MNKIILVDKEMDPSYVRSQFDEILVREITSLIAIDSDAALLTYNLSTISAIIISVEREREIRGSSDSPPERFTFNTLINELVDLGLSKDNTLFKSIESVITQGYLTQSDRGDLKAEVSAYTIVGFIDKMFPGMPGIQLVAFVMQMIDEVLSERKSLEDAKESFSQTLKNSGVSVSREKAEKKAREMALDSSVSRHTKEVAAKLKEASIKRLAQQRLKEKMQMHKDGGKPSFHFDGGSRLDKVKITSVFDTGPSPEEVKAQEIKRAEAAKKEQEIRNKAVQLEEHEKKLKEAQEAAQELEKREAELAEKEKAIKEAASAALMLEKQQAELRAKEAEMAAREAELRLREEMFRAAQQKEAMGNSQNQIYTGNVIESEKPAETDNIAKPDVVQVDPGPAQNYSENDADYEYEEEIGNESIEEDIESKIAAFEAQLTIPCPVCNKGVIKKEKTEAGKEYFICSDRSCRFVSWSQPYHFPCPMCKNPFLVDFTDPTGNKGLKCPRASCTFSQNHLGDPANSVNTQSVNRNIQPQNQMNPNDPTAQGYQNQQNHPPPPQYGYPPQGGYMQQPSGYPQQPGYPPGQQPPAAPVKKKRLVRRIKKST